MWWTLVGFLLLVCISSSGLGTCIDFWGEGCGEGKAEKRDKVKPSKREVLERLFKESLSWTPENLSPLERYVATHPEDVEALRYLKRYMQVRNVRACYIEAGLTGEGFERCEKMKSELLGRRFGNYEFLFFYSSSCPHCQRLLPVLMRELQGEKLKLVEVSPNNTELYKEWKVNTVPTLIAVDEKRRKAYRLKEFNEESLRRFLNYILSKDTSIGIDKGGNKLYKESQNKTLKGGGR